MSFQPRRERGGRKGDVSRVTERERKDRGTDGQRYKQTESDGETDISRVTERERDKQEERRGQGEKWSDGETDVSRQREETDRQT